MSEQKKEAPVDLIRKMASALAFEELIGDPQVNLTSEAIIASEKFESAMASDKQLLKIAMDLYVMDHPFEGQPITAVFEGVLDNYEALGGKYKEAFGTPMFNAQQMAGSPALAGGMTRRAASPTLAPQQAPRAQGPVKPAGAQQGQSSVPSQTSAPAAAPVTVAAPTVTTG